MKIDGKEVDQNRTSEFIVLPGKHEVKLWVRKDVRFSSNGVGRVMEWKEAYLDVPVIAQAGHTYIPFVELVEAKVVGTFRDMGINYKIECMPLRRYAIAYGGSADGRRAGCPDDN